MRVRIFYDTNAPGLSAAVESWLKRWRSAIAVLAEERGCGCHHDLYEIEAPEEALAELPEEILKKEER